MKFKAAVLAAIVGVAAIAVVYMQLGVKGDEFYFGVSYGGEDAEQAKALIDKVKPYTNFFLINSFDLTTNETALTEVCDYAAGANLKFVVYFDFISRIRYPWHQEWIESAHQRWGDKFLGIHLRDEPGGKQIEMVNNTVTSAADYSDAANQFIENISSTNSTLDAKTHGINLFTSDFALYWWDYQAGYDTVFAELGWNASSVQQIALCRGAANVQGKDWGTIITWTYSTQPYLAAPQEIYREMQLSYQAGAKYVVVFNYPTAPAGNPYGILSEKHFEAMEQFWNDIQASPRKNGGHAEAALVLPRDYGWGMRRNEYISSDRIWGLWDEDEKAPQILSNLNTLIDKYGLKLDVIYEDPHFSYAGKYSQTYLWNSTVT
ncbi:MAG: hypothetical protein NWE93_01895 [Candidatus Bathyarchaeota archaeon]|nr:hypothetical protein [Candidatus Bathyarchaeota archaeon]